MSRVQCRGSRLQCRGSKVQRRSRVEGKMLKSKKPRAAKKMSMQGRNCTVIVTATLHFALKDQRDTWTFGYSILIKEKIKPYTAQRFTGLFTTLACRSLLAATD